MTITRAELNDLAARAKADATGHSEKIDKLLGKLSNGAANLSQAMADDGADTLFQGGQNPAPKPKA